jgi:hypothetical protein
MKTPRKRSSAKVEGAANLETQDGKLKIYSLAGLLKHKQTHRHHRKMATLSEVIGPWFEKTVEKPAEKLGPCVDVWLAHVPAKLATKTRIAGFYRGTLTISAESAIVRAELDAALRKGLLQTLQTASKGIIYRVKTAVAAREIPEIS